MCLLAAGLLAGSGCQTKVPAARKGWESKKGWLSLNHYQVIVVGKPNPSSIGMARRQAQSKKAAVTQGQLTMRDELLNRELYDSCSKQQRKTKLCEHVGELVDVVNHGQVIKITFNEEDECTMVYRAYAGKLKRLVDAIQFNVGKGEKKPDEE